MSKKILIVGGVAGGATSATRLRRLDETASIIMFERGPYVSFANCGLPYHIGEVIKERSNLVVTTKEALWNRYRIDVRTETEVIAVHPESKEVTVRAKDGSEYKESYDELILSPGAMPLTPPIPGINHELVKSLRNIPDMDKIKEIVDGGAKSCAVIGGGFIGIEVAENLIHRGLNVTLIEAAPHILAPLDTEISMICEKEMRDNGIELIINDGVKSFTEISGGIRTETASGRQIDADFVVAAIGVRPDTAFLKESGIELNPRGYIKVNERMATSADHIWAAGDAVETFDSVTGGAATIALAGPANRQARIIADNIMGINRTYKGSQGTSILQIFDLVAASTGNNERQLRQKGIDYRAYFVHPMNHATYYPGAMQLTAKILVDPQGKLLGAQAVGYEGVDKFIDVLAAVLWMKGDVNDLADLDLAYAPPFLSAKSPANMAGFTAQNDLEGLVKSRTFLQFESEYNKETDLIIDVREEVEFEQHALPGAINIPLNSLRERLGEIPAGKRLWTYCSIGLRGYTANRILTQHGFEAFNLAGGTRLLALGTVEETHTGGHKGKQDVMTTHEDGTQVLPEEHVQAAAEAVMAAAEPVRVIEVDACGLSCPGPLMKMKENMDKINPGEVLHIRASDPGFYEDVKAWARRTGTEVLSLSKAKGFVDVQLKKAASLEECILPVDPTCQQPSKNKTLVVFSGDLDKAIASFIIANGAAAMGGKVTMFFTFWGINVLRKSTPVSVQKNFIESLFGRMMPRGAGKLGLSKMNMAGMGPAMIKKIMKDKNVDSLESLMMTAQKNGVELVACQMSMDLLGLKLEELIDGVKVGGVGYYLGDAEESAVNLFI
ncbi:FAD-dependent oxidoreductase [Clostridiaceae bacterium HFYG-1003]|nr:FAD-dependent oxidoreductase [Clostridiaceae bacterium HFYG-1003]